MKPKEKRPVDWELQARGITDTEIGQHLGCSRGWVNMVRRGYVIAHSLRANRIHRFVELAITYGVEECRRNREIVIREILSQLDLEIPDGGKAKKKQSEPSGEDTAFSP